MSVNFVISLVVLASFSLCQASTPSINVQGQNTDGFRYYDPRQAITNLFGWPNASNNGHALGGMQFSNDEITVPEEGVYFIYATLRVHGLRQRFALRINSVDIFYGVPAGSGHVSVTGTYYLKKGDRISLRAIDRIVVYVHRTHANFGAFKIGSTDMHFK